MIKCQECGFLHKGNSMNFSECSECGNNDLNKFIRIDKKDLYPEKYLSNRDTEWLKEMNKTTCIDKTRCVINNCNKKRYKNNLICKNHYKEISGVFT